MEADLGLSTYGFNIGACLYYAVYFFTDIPAALSVKKFGFITLPLSCIAFGIVTLGTTFIHNEASFYAIRESCWVLPSLFNSQDSAMSFRGTTEERK